MRLNYIQLINRFWALHRTSQFSSNAISLYFYILDVANSSRWSQKFSLSDRLTSASLGISLPTLRSARLQLIEAGLLSHITGGTGKAAKGAYIISDCHNCKYKDSECPQSCTVQNGQNSADIFSPNEPKVKKYEQKNDDIFSPKPDIQPQNPVLGEKIEAKTFTSLYSNTKTKQYSTTSEAVDHFDLENINPPSDGKPRNLPALKEKLRSMAASPADIRLIMLYSDFGAIGNPVWTALSEIRNANGAIKSPVRFVLSRITP